MANFQNEREQLAQLEWLFQQKKFAEGLAGSESSLREHPASFQLKFLRYRFLRQLQQNTEALQLLRELHAMSGDNIMVVRELADLHYQQKQFPESLLYYKKLLFLDSFNSQAQERVKQLQGMLETGVSDRLADTRPEFRPEVVPPAAPSAPAAADAPPAITFDSVDEVAPAAADAPPAITFDSVDEVAPAAAQAEAGLNFQTESAAELYFKQGMYREALAIYKNLFEKTGRTDHFHKIQAILQLLRADRNSRVIARLQRFLELLQGGGRQLV